MIHDLRFTAHGVKIGSIVDLGKLGVRAKKGKVTSNIQSVNYTTETLTTDDCASIHDHLLHKERMTMHHHPTLNVRMEIAWT